MSLTFDDIAMPKAEGVDLFLVDLARTFDISFAVRPAHIAPAIEQPEIGLEVELVGTHPTVGTHIRERCGHCLGVLLVLLDLADWALQSQHGAVLVQNINVQCDRLARHQSDRARWPQVVLALTVIRHANLEHGAKDWIPQTAAEMGTALLELGCREACLDCVS